MILTKVTVILENSSLGDLNAAHGLSIYVETGENKILLDAGPDGSLFADNAEKLGIDLGKINMAVLSHGHYDHSGGMLAFLEKNKTAKLYAANSAFARHLSGRGDREMRYIGVDPSVTELYSERIVPTGGRFEISPEIELFSDVKTADYLTSACKTMFEETDGVCECDRFLHEQNLLINENGKIVLLSGCAHRGIVNILRRAEEICGCSPDYVFSGYHLRNPSAGGCEPEELIRAIGGELKARDCIYYTGHCTGEKPFAILKEMLGDQIHPMPAGTVVEI